MEHGTRMNLAIGIAVLRGRRVRVWRDASGDWWATTLADPLPGVAEPCS